MISKLQCLLSPKSSNGNKVSGIGGLIATRDFYKLLKEHVAQGKSAKNLHPVYSNDERRIGSLPVPSLSRKVKKNAKSSSATTITDNEGGDNNQNVKLDEDWSLEQKKPKTSVKGNVVVQIDQKALSKWMHFLLCHY